MNGGQRAEPSGTQPRGEVDAAGEKLWEIHSSCWFNAEVPERCGTQA